MAYKYSDLEMSERFLLAKLIRKYWTPNFLMQSNAVNDGFLPPRGLSWRGRFQSLDGLQKMECAVSHTVDGKVKEVELWKLDAEGRPHHIKRVTVIDMLSQFRNKKDEEQ